MIVTLAGCGVRTEEPSRRSGTAGEPVYLSVQPTHLQANQMVEWHFTQLPDGIILTQYDFDPSPRSQQVVFTPPDTGVYEINYTIKELTGNPVLKKPFILTVHRRQQSTSAADTAKTGSAPEAISASGAAEADAISPERDESPEVARTESRETVLSDSPDSRPGALEKVPGRYTVQVAAWESFSNAESMASQLKRQGHEAYIQRVQFPDTGEIWYRVRIGSYQSASAARSVMHRLERLSLLRGQDIWVDFQRKNR